MKLRLSLATTIAAVALTSVGAVVAAADPILAPFDTATFGSPTDSIPTNKVRLFTGNGVTLGLTAHTRCEGDAPQVCGPALTDNGVDTFYAQTGTPFAAPNGSLAGWNFGFYGAADSSTSAVFGQLKVVGPGGLNFTLGPTLPGPFVLGPTAAQDSWNIGFNFINGNANLAGLYTITFTAFSANLAELGKSEIYVNVPEPTTLGLLGLGLVALARRARKNA